MLAGPSHIVCADVVAPRSGKKVEGAIVSQNDREVVLNIYWSRNPGVTNPEHVFRLPRTSIKKVEVAPRPHVEVFRRLAAASDAPGCFEAGTYAKSHKLKYHARLCFAHALTHDAAHKEALKAVGGPAKWNALRRGNPHFDKRLSPLLARYAASDDLATRKDIAAELKAASFAVKPHVLERYRRSAKQPTGYQEDRPVAWNAPNHPGAVYTLFVPKAYEPHRSWPLIIGLHGGGPDGVRGDEVVGSGPSAMNFYRRQAAKRGFIVACPNALMASWGRMPNEQLVRDVIAEVCALYHVDLDRIYLTGHSMGGFGTWALGPRMAETFAAVSPMAGSGRGGVQRLVDTRTPIFIYHSKDDYIAVQPDRLAAKALKEAGADFVYTEFPNAGHGFPDSVQVELFDFFAPRRLFRKGAKDLWPRSSFAVPVTKEERLALGDPMDAWKGVEPDLKAWVAALRYGGGRSLSAAQRIAAAKPADAAVAVAKVLGQAALPFDARGYAARCLADLGARDQASALAKALGVAPSKDQSFVAVEVAHALATIGGPDQRKAIERALEAWTKFFEDKVPAGGPVAFSDWNRALDTLTAVVEAWRAASKAGEPKAIRKTVIARVLAPNHEVRTSERVPQDPSRARTALAQAVAKAYASVETDEAYWDALLKAVAADPRATAAVQHVREKSQEPSGG